MILSFKKQFPWKKPTNFKAKILSGKKIHSIREDSKNRWTVGRLIHMAYGVRTKFYDCFRKTEHCKSIQSIAVLYFDRGVVQIHIDGELYCHHDRFVNHSKEKGNLLAKNDGFDSLKDFFKWFSSDFQGKIIHWTDFRY